MSDGIVSKWVGTAIHWLLYDRCQRRCCKANLMHPFMVA
jgi:hypothetical protein